jgi:phage FluMu protein Com
MLPQYKALQTRLVNKAVASAPTRKKCPKCGRVRQLEKFGIRTQHAKNGRPERSLPQSWCRDCRKGQ